MPDVQFTDSSAAGQGIVSWLWNFGDGQTSTEQNPLHTYAAEGIYTVSLTVKNECGSEKNQSMDVEVVCAGGCSIIPIAVGETKQGTLSSDCESINRTAGTYYAVFFGFTLTEDVQALEITVLNTSIDSYMYLLQGNTIDSPMIDYNDDYSGLLSGLVKDLSAGDYVVEVTTYDPGTTGDISLKLYLPECDADHLNLCDKTGCDEIDLFWWDEKCNTGTKADVRMYSWNLCRSNYYHDQVNIHEPPREDRVWEDTGANIYSQDSTVLLHIGTEGSGNLGDSRDEKGLSLEISSNQITPGCIVNSVVLHLFWVSAGHTLDGHTLVFVPFPLDVYGDTTYELKNTWENIRNAPRTNASSSKTFSTPKIYDGTSGEWVSIDITSIAQELVNNYTGNLPYVPVCLNFIYPRSYVRHSVTFAGKKYPQSGGDDTYSPYVTFDIES